MAMRKDALGNPVVFVQRQDVSGGKTTWQVIDKTRPAGEKLIAEYEQESLATAHAEMVWKTP